METKIGKILLPFCIALGVCQHQRWWPSDSSAPQVLNSWAPVSSLTHASVPPVSQQASAESLGNTVTNPGTVAPLQRSLLSDQWEWRGSAVQAIAILPLKHCLSFPSSLVLLEISALTWSFTFEAQLSFSGICCLLTGRCLLHKRGFSLSPSACAYLSL